MAQLNITLNQDEILQLLSGNRDNDFKKLLKDSRNGFRDRPLTTRIDQIERLNKELKRRSKEQPSPHGTRAL